MNRRDVLSALAGAPVGAVAAMLPDGGETAKTGDAKRQERVNAFLRLSKASVGCHSFNTLKWSAVLCAETQKCEQEKAHYVEIATDYSNKHRASLAELEAAGKALLDLL